MLSKEVLSARVEFNEKLRRLWEPPIMHAAFTDFFFGKENTRGDWVRFGDAFNGRSLPPGFETSKSFVEGTCSAYFPMRVKKYYQLYNDSNDKENEAYKKHSQAYKELRNGVEEFEKKHNAKDKITLQKLCDAANKHFSEGLSDEQQQAFKMYLKDSPLRSFLKAKTQPTLKVIIAYGHEAEEEVPAVAQKLLENVAEKVQAADEHFEVRLQSQNADKWKKYIAQYQEDLEKYATQASKDKTFDTPQHEVLEEYKNIRSRLDSKEAKDALDKKLQKTPAFKKLIKIDTKNSAQTTVNFLYDPSKDEHAPYAVQFALAELNHACNSISAAPLEQEKKNVATEKPQKPYPAAARYNPSRNEDDNRLTDHPVITVNSKDDTKPSVGTANILMRLKSFPLGPTTGYVFPKAWLPFVALKDKDALTKKEQGAGIMEPDTDYVRRMQYWGEKLAKYVAAGKIMFVQEAPSTDIGGAAFKQPFREKDINVGSVNNKNTIILYDKELYEDITDKHMQAKVRTLLSLLIGQPVSAQKAAFALLKNKATGKVIPVLNVHMDFGIAKSVNVLRALQSFPGTYGGDFNIAKQLAALADDPHAIYQARTLYDQADATLAETVLGDDSSPYKSQGTTGTYDVLAVQDAFDSLDSANDAMKAFIGMLESQTLPQCAKERAEQQAKSDAYREKQELEAAQRRADAQQGEEAKQSTKSKPESKPLDSRPDKTKAAVLPPVVKAAAATVSEQQLPSPSYEQRKGKLPLTAAVVK
jgi:hypothetical protein